MTRVTATSVQTPGGLCSPGEWKLQADPALDVDMDRALLNKDTGADFLYQTPRLQDTAGKTVWDGERTDQKPGDGPAETAPGGPPKAVMQQGWQCTEPDSHTSSKANTKASTRARERAGLEVRRDSTAHKGTEETGDWSA